MTDELTRVYITFVETDADVFEPLLCHHEANWDHGREECLAAIEAVVATRSTDTFKAKARTVCIVLPPGVPDSLFYPQIDASQCTVSEEKAEAR